MDSYTVSLSMEKTAEYHSRRQDAYGNEYIPLSADRSLKDKNVVIYDCGDDKAHLNEYMKPFIDEYNDSPTCKHHKDRKKSYDYYEAIRDGSEGYGKGKAKERPEYHMVASIGNNDALKCTDDSFDALIWREYRREDEEKASKYLQEHYVVNPKREKAKQMLVEYAQNFQKMAENNPNIVLHGLIIHDDEPCAAPHLDIRISLVCVDQKSGLKSRISMNKAMQQMGYGKSVYKKAPKDSNGFYMLQPWWEVQKNEIEAVMNANGWTREIKGDESEHSLTAEYWNEVEAEAYSQVKKEAETASKQRDLLKKGLDQMAEQGEALLNEKDAKIEALNANMNAMSEDLHASHEAKSRTEAENEALKASNTEKDAKIEALDVSNTEKDAKIEALNANMNAMSEDLHALDEAKSHTEAENEALKASNAQKDANIQALQNDLVDKERLIAQNEALYKEVERLRDENMDLSSQNDKKTAENKALVNEIIRKDKDIAKKDKEIAEKDDKIKQQEADIKQKDSLINELKKKVESLKQKIDSIATYARDVIQAFKNGVSSARPTYKAWEARIKADNVTLNPVEIPISTPMPSPTPMPLRTVRHDTPASLRTARRSGTSKNDEYNPLDFTDLTL